MLGVWDLMDLFLLRVVTVGQVAQMVALVDILVRAFMAAAVKHLPLEGLFRPQPMELAEQFALFGQALQEQLGPFHLLIPATYECAGSSCYCC